MQHEYRYICNHTCNTSTAISATLSAEIASVGSFSALMSMSAGRCSGCSESTVPVSDKERIHPGLTCFLSTCRVCLCLCIYACTHVRSM